MLICYNYNTCKRCNDVTQAQALIKADYHSCRACSVETCFSLDTLFFKVSKNWTCLNHNFYFSYTTMLLLSNNATRSIFYKKVILNASIVIVLLQEKPHQLRMGQKVLWKLRALHYLNYFSPIQWYSTHLHWAIKSFLNDKVP